MIVAGVWTGVGFSNLKISGPGFKIFGTGAESEKVTPATCEAGSAAVANLAWNLIRRCFRDKSGLGKVQAGP